MQLLDMRLAKDMLVGLGAKKILIALMVAVLAGAVTYTFLGDNSNHKKNFSANKVKIIDVAVRKTVPELSAVSYSGDPLSFRSDSIIVLNFWASWCAPCRQETPLFVAIAKDFPDVQFIGLTNDDTKGAALSFAEKFGITYEIGDGNSYMTELANVQPIYGLPTTLIIDRNGRIAAKVIGGITDAEFRKALTDLAQE
jgi:thiol-disulfide isomerase/thioredoxin